jgi:CCCH zinc finger in TRM13 protein
MHGDEDHDATYHTRAGRNACSCMHWFAPTKMASWPSSGTNGIADCSSTSICSLQPSTACLLRPLAGAKHGSNQGRLHVRASVKPNSHSGCLVWTRTRTAQRGPRCMASQDRPQRCQFYIHSKARYCRFEARVGSKYCGNHISVGAGGPGADKRIPCPYDITQCVPASPAMRYRHTPLANSACPN